jgi:diaminohydroxyphosphoribosylaminopyrimidine deaminase/5-amino-6-(5-phosphoribosylamino)uracil reductase
MTKHDHATDEIFMRRAMELALRGMGCVSPNPMVGCVIVHNDRIIGEGWHREYGGPHAEVHAIDNVANKDLIRESTCYVNLEPCSHTGKTPPCADLLVHHHVKRVVIANMDSNPLVAGNGARKLRTAGIEVHTGILDSEGRELNRRFFTYFERQRPFIVLKWAETADGFIAQENFDSKWISNRLSRQLVHKWRAEEDAILVGAKTAAHDNPQLNVRDWTGRQPIRIVIDRFLKLDDRLHLFDGKQRTILFNLIRHEERPNLSLALLDESDFLNSLLDSLHKQGIQSVMVEGGTFTINQFITAGLWDEARIFRTCRIFGRGIPAPRINGHKIGHQTIAADLLETYRP